MSDYERGFAKGFERGFKAGREGQWPGPAYCRVYADITDDISLDERPGRARGRLQSRKGSGGDNETAQVVVKQLLRTTGHKLKPSSRTKVRLPEKRASSFYLSPEWRALIASIIRQRGRQCEDPAHDPALPRYGVRIFGDHVHELKDGGAPLEQSNILLRCSHCHQRKTMIARKDRHHG